MSKLNQDLQQRLQELQEQGLYRQLRRIDSPQGPHVQLNGQALLNFSSNDYLGLANHEAVKEAAHRAIQDYGAGSGASRLISGSLHPHHQLEATIAAFKRTEAALTFASGYSAATGLIDALMEKGDVVIIDKLSHACIIDAARLCRAKLRVFAHNDLNELEQLLRWADRQRPWGPVDHRPRKLIITESVFSMDGDLAPLKEIADLKDKYDAWLLLDEAHATGLFGQNRRGLAEAFQVADRVDIQMGTLGKALGASGGYFCGSRTLIDFLINKARSFIFSTAPNPATAGAATAAIKIVESNEGETRRAGLWARIDEIKNGLQANNWMVPAVQSAIIPLILGSEDAAVRLADELRKIGIYIPAIRYPTVPRGTARLRLSVSAQHTPVDVSALLAALALCQSRGLIPSLSPQR